MTGHEWVGNALQTTLLQINVRAANLRKFNLQECRVWLELRFRDLANFDR